MKPALKLSAIDQEHLQELYDASGVARDELPYTPKYDELVQGFQDRTFKNAEPEQVFGAILKYVRSSSNSSAEVPTPASIDVSDDQLKQLKIIVSRYMVGGKILPYSDEVNSARAEFNKVTQLNLGEADFWLSIQRMQGAKRRPPKRAKVAAIRAAADDDDDAE